MIALPVMAVIHFRCDGDGAFDVRGNLERYRTNVDRPDWNGVVISDGVDRLDLVVIDELAFLVHDGRLVKLCARGSSIAVRLEEAAVIDLLALGILDSELDPGFI